MIKSTDDGKIYFVTIPAHKFLHIKTMRVTGIGIFGKSKILFQDRTTKQSAAYSTVSKANWTSMAGVKLTAEAFRLWHT